jgi:large subunit ribosomal protein L18
MARNVSENRRRSRRLRHLRVRKALAGTGPRPRLAVYRSLQHIYAQVIDDERGHTLVAASTRDPALAGELSGKSKREQAEVIGRAVAERARSAGVETVVFDRGGYNYHGRVKVLAEAARGAGLAF